ncbi:MAG: UbiA family prenyltransferase [Halodesulfurarchaeum sp.]
MSSNTANRTVASGATPPLYWYLLSVGLTIGKRVKNVILYTQLDIVGMGVAGTLTVMYVLGLELSLAPVVVGLVTFGVYVGDRISDIKRDPEATSDRNAFMKRHKTALSVGSAVGYGLAIAIAVLGGPFALAVTIVPGLVWVLYASDVMASAGLLKRLKRVLVLNSALVAFGWATALVFVPLAFAEAAVSPIAMVLFAYFFLDIYINAEIPNFRDVADDAANGVSTLPTVFGVRRSRQLLYAINALIVFVLAFAYLQGLLTLVVTVAVLLGRGYAIGVNSLVGRTERYRLLELAGEMKHVFVGLLLLGVLLR